MGEVAEIGRSNMSDLLTTLTRVGIVDIGTITGFAASTGRASVMTFQVFGQERLELKDVEVLLIGTGANGFEGSLVGSPCLIIYPRSVVPSMREQKVMWQERPYSPQGVKCIPLSTRPDRSRVHLGFDNLGQFVISSENYVVTISDEGILYTNKDNTLQYDITGSSNSTQVSGGGHIHTTVGVDGSYELYYLDDNGLVAYRVKYLPDGTYTVQRGAYTAWEEEVLDDHDSFHDYAWETIYQMDGTVTETLRAIQDGDDEKPIRIEEITPDGTVTRVLNSEGDPEKPLVVETYSADGSIDIKQTNADGDELNQITITADGDVTIKQGKAENTVTLTQDGKLTITTKDAVSVNAGGNAVVSADGDIQATSKGKMELVTGSTLKAGSSSLTLKTILIDDLLNTLLANFDTTGSPAAHMTGPGAKANISTLASKWGQLLA